MDLSAIKFMDIWEAIRQLIQVVEEGVGSTKENEKAVVYLLDVIALNMHSIKSEGDIEYGKIPESDTSAIQKLAGFRFPNWGYYNLPDDVTENIASTKIIVGDAIDDILDIVCDLKEVMWLYENEGEQKALFLLRESYDIHWQQHLRDLQFYLQNLAREA